jgi:hypothetical protein
VCKADLEAALHCGSDVLPAVLCGLCGRGDVDDASVGMRAFEFHATEPSVKNSEEDHLAAFRVVAVSRTAEIRTDLRHHKSERKE